MSHFHAAGHSSLSLAAVIGLVVAVWVLIKTPELARYIIKQVFKDAIAAYVWRHFSGSHYHGKRVTDATWFSHGGTSDRRHDHGGFMDRWEHLPRFRRLLWRWAVTFALTGTAYGMFADRAVTLHALESLGVYGLVAAGFVIETRIHERMHRRHVLNPIVKSLAPAMRMSPHAVRRLVHIKSEGVRQDEGEIGWIELPDEFTPGPDLQTTMTRIVDAHLPVDIELDFQLQAQPRMAVVRADLKPPDMVPWEDMLEAMAACSAGDVILGKDRFKKPFDATFTGLDDPHWGFSVNTGRGKSNFLAVVVAQILHQDPEAEIVIIDPKRTSLVDYVGSPISGNGLKPMIPGVRMANNPNDPEAMWEAIAYARAVLEARSKLAERDRTAKFPICLVVVDELNMFTDITYTHWDSVRAERAAAGEKMIPKECQVWSDIRAILRTGRFVSVHMIAVSQDFRDDAVGGKGARNYFGFRGLAGFRPNQWKMFVGTTPVPRDQRGPGRWIFTDGNDETWVQVTRADADQVYDYAMQGRALHGSGGSVRMAVPGPLALSLDQESPDRQTPPDYAAQGILVGLREAADYLGMKLATFEKARQRTESDGTRGKIPGEIRVARQPAWYASDLDDWKSNRPGSKKEQ